MRSLTALCSAVLASSFAANADEDAAKQARLDATARLATLQAPATEPPHGMDWEVDAFLNDAILDGQPQTDFFQGNGADFGLEAHLMLWPWVGVEAEVQYATFGGLFGGPGGSALFPAAGLRFNPKPGLDWGRFYFSAHAGDAFTGSLNRFGFDVGAGIEWDFGRLRVGPTVRFLDVTSQPSTHELGGDAHVILLGFSIGFGSKQPEITLKRSLAQEAVVRSRLGSLMGWVADPDGKPLAGKVVVTPLDDDGEPETVAAAPNYEVRLRAGQYHLEASAPGHHSSSREVVIDGDEIVESDFTLQPFRSAPPPAAPLPMAVLTPTEIEVRQTIEFELDSARLRPSAQPILNEVASILRQHPDLRVCIEGHTDDLGDDSYNLELSRERAESVRSYLYGAGIQVGRVEARGFGLTRPLVPNDSEASRAQNRRVEFKIIPPAEAPGGAPGRDGSP